MRYHQARIDSDLLDKGKLYPELNESYIIFICTFDAYRRGLPAYTIERVCLEEGDTKIKDDSHWLVLNTTAWDKDADSSRANLLQYVDNGTVHDELSKRLESEVDKANSDRKWRGKAVGFMTQEHSNQALILSARRDGIELGMQQGLRDGIEQGEAVQSARYNALIDLMLDEGRVDDLKRAANDPVFREELFQQYNL